MRSYKTERIAGAIGCLVILFCMFWIVKHAKPPITVSIPRSALPASEGFVKIDVRFSPKGGCTEEIVAQLNKATRHVRVLAYSFTSQPILDAIIHAADRGVDVKVILDKSDLEGKSLAHPLIKSGIPTFIDRHHAIAHNKVIVIDEAIVLTGSFNFTNAAENHNAENLLTIYSRPLAAEYLHEWGKHLDHSEGTRK